MGRNHVDRYKKTSLRALIAETTTSKFFTIFDSAWGQGHCACRLLRLPRCRDLAIFFCRQTTTIDNLKPRLLYPRACARVIFSLKIWSIVVIPKNGKNFCTHIYIGKNGTTKLCTKTISCRHLLQSFKFYT